MFGLLVVIAVALSSIWVYLDATKNKIGRVPGNGGFFNMSAGAWAAVTLLLWIIGFPAYLLKRSTLVQLAASSPVEVTGRVPKVFLLSLVGGLWVLNTAAALVPVSEPKSASSTPPMSVSEAQQPEDVAPKAQPVVAAAVTMTEADKDQCAARIQIYIRIAEREAQYLGAERAVEKTSQAIEANVDERCKIYALQSGLLG